MKAFVTARGALGWYRPSVGVPRDVGCRRGIREANLRVQFSSGHPVCWGVEAPLRGVVKLKVLLVVGLLLDLVRVSVGAIAFAHRECRSRRSGGS